MGKSMGGVSEWGHVMKCNWAACVACLFLKLPFLLLKHQPIEWLILETS